MNGRFAHITGWGMAVPERVLTNDELAQMVDTDDAWIQARTGILERRIAAPDETTASLAVDATLSALRVANLPPVDLDLIIVSTSTPDYLFPATACLVQDRIGATKAGAFDLLAACTGFIYAVNMAAQAIRTGSIDNAVVIGAETLSRLIDWNDRGTCILFGDGAGAFVLQASDQPGGVAAAVMRSDGSGEELLKIPGGGSALPASEHTFQDGQHFIKMNGREVFRFATRVMAQAAEEAAAKANLKMEDVKLIIPHQANKRIIDAAARGLKMPIDRFVINLEKYGNTSTASIPIATCEAVEQNRLHPGDQVIFVGFGAGLTWGSLAAQWSGPFPTARRVHMRPYRWLAALRSVLRRAFRWLEGLIWGRRQ